MNASWSKQNLFEETAAIGQSAAGGQSKDPKINGCYPRLKRGLFLNTLFGKQGKGLKISSDVKTFQKRTFTVLVTRWREGGAPAGRLTAREERLLSLEVLLESVFHHLKGAAWTVLDQDHRTHVDQLKRRFAFLECLRQVQDLTPHHRHLLLEQITIEAFVILNWRERGRS